MFDPHLSWYSPGTPESLHLEVGVWTQSQVATNSRWRQALVGVVRETRVVRTAAIFPFYRFFTFIMV